MRRLAVLSLHTSPLLQPGAGDGGGMNVYVASLATALARAGVDCDVYTRAWRPALPAVETVEPGFAVHHVDAGPRRHLDGSELRHAVDAFTAGVLDRLHDSQPDLIHANYWLSGIAGHALKHELALPLVSTFHTLERVKARDFGSRDGERAAAEAAVMGCSDAIVASSTVEAGQLQELYGADPARVEVVVPGVDHEMFSPGDKLKARAELGIDGDAPMLLFVGRIQRLKGVDIAIEALAQLAPPVHLVVVGGPSGDDGEDEMRRLKTLVRACSLDGRVRFVAPQPHDHLSTYYRAADACLVPSRSESFGLVALEAAACGTPVVASAVGGLRTLVDDGRTGFLVEAGDATHLATAVGQLLGSPGLAAKMGATAAQRSQRYSWSMTAARLRRLCTDLTVSELLECQ